MAQNPGSGNALEFDSGEYVDLGGIFSGVSLPVSVAVWIKPDINGGIHRIFFSHSLDLKYRGFWFQIYNGDLSIGYGDGTSISSTSRRIAIASIVLQSNKWYHIAGTIVSATDMDLYLNGNPLAVTYSGSGGAMYVDTTHGNIGHALGFSPLLDGELDELSVWGKALTQTEIRDMMCHKLVGNETDLLAYYRFDDGAGTSLTNYVSGGTDGTLMNNPTWVASSAPVGDRSFHNYFNHNAAIGFSTTIDSIVADPANTGTAGTHIYVVDTLPLSTSGISVPSGVEYYFGVFNVDYNKSYDVSVYPGPVTGTAAVNSIKLAKRPHNASPAWSLTTAMNNPSIILPAQSPISQYILASDPCADFDFNLGNDTAICGGSSFKIGRPKSTGEVYQWSNATTADSMVVSGPGIYWLKVTRPSGCFEEDTIVISTVGSNTNYLPNDSTACDSMRITALGSLANIAWSNGVSGTHTNVVYSSGLLWFQAIDTVSGCSVSDTIDVTILNSSMLPGSGLDTVLCGMQSFTYDATIAGAISYVWFDGQTQPVRTFTGSGSYGIERHFPGGCIIKDTVTLYFSTLAGDAVEEDEYFICEDDTVNVELISTNYLAVLWSDGTNGWQTKYWQPGTYWVETQNMDGCWETDTFKLTAKEPISELSIFSDTSFCTGKGIILMPPKGIWAEWPNGSTGPYYVNRTQDIRVEVSDGCTKAVEYFNVTEYSCGCDVKFPDAFTPNGDELNDYFGPVTRCNYTRYSIQIFNRFGSHIFTSTDPENQFDGTMEGKELPIGVYVYIFSYNTPKSSGTARGYFTLVR